MFYLLRTAAVLAPRAKRPWACDQDELLVEPGAKSVVIMVIMAILVIMFTLVITVIIFILVIMVTMTIMLVDPVSRDLVEDPLWLLRQAGEAAGTSGGRQRQVQELVGKPGEQMLTHNNELGNLRIL